MPGLDLDLDEGQQAIRDTLAKFCAERVGADALRAQDGAFPEVLWKELSTLGVLALATPEGDGGAMELVAALEPLGAAAFPGPLAQTFFATQVLPEAERCALARGALVAAVGAPPLLPWAPAAGVFVELAGERAFLGEPSGPVEPVETLGGEPWGRVALRRAGELLGVARAHALHDLAVGAYLAGAGLALVEATAEHARTRRQFGRAIGEFQAVAHPLAQAHIALAGAQTLARAAAFAFDAGPADLAFAGGARDARTLAAAARLSATRAALEGAHTAHQLFGAVGITLEGPVYHVSRRIRQLASQPPDPTGARESVLASRGI